MASAASAVGCRETETERDQNDRDCARVGIAAKQFVQKEGCLPNDLNALVPRHIDNLPREPFFAKPLSYRKENGKGVISFTYPDNEWTGTFAIYEHR